jgi:hypothetical protein
MMSARTWLCAALIGAASCQPMLQGPPPPTRAEPLVMRTYDVPAGFSDRLEIMLNRLYQRPEGDTTTPLVRAMEGPNGSLIVMGPESVHEGVRKLVSDLDVHEVSAPSTVAFDYWFLWAEPSAKSLRPSPRLATLADALDAVEKVDGTMSWSLHATRRVIGLEGELVKGRAEDVSVEQVSQMNRETGILTAELQVEVGHRAGAHTRVGMKPGQTLVLGAFGDQDGGTLYTLVRAELVGG